MNRYRDRIRRAVFARPYVPPVEADTTPDPFAFVDQDGLDPGELAQSNIITIMGIDAPSPASISMSGGLGQYRKNGGAWTSSLGAVANGDTVQLQANASVTAGGFVTIILTVGGFAATWTITTAEGGQLDFSDPDQSGLLGII